MQTIIAKWFLKNKPLLWFYAKKKTYQQVLPSAISSPRMRGLWKCLVRLDQRAPPWFRVSWRYLAGSVTNGPTESRLHIALHEASFLTTKFNTPNWKGSTHNPYLEKGSAQNINNINPLQWKAFSWNITLSSSIVQLCFGAESPQLFLYYHCF
jgi:hypothetical protein